MDKYKIIIRKTSEDTHSAQLYFNGRRVDDASSQFLGLDILQKYVEMCANGSFFLGNHSHISRLEMAFSGGN